MTIALLLILASALVGAATGFMYKVWALVLISPPIAILAAAVLHSHGFGMIGGVIVIAICLVVCQIAYLAVACLQHVEDISSQDEVDGEPREAGEKNIRSHYN